MDVEALNYHHLRYFWTAAREGSVTRASERLHISQPTVSAQIRALEESLGEKLFERSGRRLVLTDIGRVVYGFAEEIFGLGRDLADAVRHASTQPLRVKVGLTNALSKLVTYRLLEPVLRLPGPVQIECREDSSERLLAALALHDVDVVLSDAPADPAVKVQAYSHLLGESGVVVFGTGKLARDHRRGFPRSLDGAPFILPTEETAVRRMVDAWFDEQEVRPRVVGEFDDSALSKAFGSAGVGLFFAPSAIAREVRRQYGVEVVGRPRTPRLRYYAISVERRLRHPAVTAIFQAARADLFA